MIGFPVERLGSPKTVHPVSGRHDRMKLQEKPMSAEFASRNETIWDRWYANVRATPDREAIIHWIAGEEPYRWTFSSLMTAAASYAGQLLARGIRRGHVCAMIIRHHREFYPIYMGISLAGAIPAVLAYPNPRLHPDKFRQGIEGMSQRSGLDWILTERELAPVLSPLFVRHGSTVKAAHYPLEWELPDAPDKDLLSRLEEIRRTASGSDPFLLQHSSGTTGLQKPVLLCHRAVLRHVDLYGQAIGLGHNDRVISWLPLYHDMGLIAAFHLPLALGVPSVQLDPFEWVLAPSILLEAVSKENGTIMWLPNFAYNMMADKVREEQLEGVTLRSLRMVVNCSEPVRFESHERFRHRFQPYGLCRSALASCYAMAETTFAVSQSAPKQEPLAVAVDRSELAKGRVKILESLEGGRICVSSGRVIPGCQVRIVDDNRRDAPSDMVGEIAIQSVSMFDGYRNYPEKTAEVLQDGWYYSGDSGFRIGDDLFVVGRKKDLIIVAGNNVYPEDVEDAVGRVEGILAGRVVAFGEDDPAMGSEQVSVVAETTAEDEAAKRALMMEVRKAAMAINVTLGQVYLVPPRWLIKSSAGKPSRKANRDRLVREA